MSLYVRYEDKEDLYIILNRKYSEEKLEELLWTRTNLTEEQIEEVLQEGMILEKGETFELRTIGRAIITTEKENIITLLGDRQRVIFYPNASFESVVLLRDKVEDWFLKKIKRVKEFFFA